MRPMLQLPQRQSQTTPWAQAISTVGGAVGGFYRDGGWQGAVSGAQEGHKIGTLAGGGIDSATGRDQPQPAGRGEMMQPVSQPMSPGKAFNAFMSGLSTFSRIGDLAPKESGVKTPSGGSAIDRRYDAIQESPDYKLNRASIALETAPPEIRDEYGPTIEAARRRIRQNGRA